MGTDETGQPDERWGLLLDGRYRLFERIGRGGMATVYRALDERLDREVAVKVMHPSYADDPEFVARFTREARSAARLNSPEVVAVFDQGHDEQAGLVYLVMEHVPGRDLRALLRERGSLSPARALEVLESVLSALAAAHGAGIVHRDVKPENVLLGDNRIKVADFGLARAFEGASVTVTRGVVIGTVNYLAPEQIEHGKADPRTDVYAAGILLWEMLVGRPPVTGDTAVNVLYQHVNTDVPPPSTQVEGISPALDDLVVRATRRDPARRPLDGSAFLSEVRALRDDLPATTRATPTHDTTRRHTLVVPPQGTERPPLARPPRVAPTDTAPHTRGPQVRRSRRRGLIAAVVVLVLGLLAGTGGWWFASGRYTSAPDVRQVEQEVAETTLREAGFGVSVAPAPVFSETVEKGFVVSQDPGPDDRVLRNGTVTLVLSKGKERLKVPALPGLTEAAAAAALTRAGLLPGTVTKDYSGSVPAGRVISSDPVAGTEHKRDTSVSYLVSRGIEQLPVPADLAGQTAEIAVARLKAAGFVDKVVRDFSEDVPEGAVVKASPASGTAGRGSAITLTVSRGPKLRTIPGNLIGMSKGQARAALEALGLKVRVVEFFGIGTVQAVDPGPGTQVPRGSTVRIGIF